MAASPETPFALLLRADSEHPLPDSDPEVIAALNAYGAVFNKTKKHAAARLDLLAGLLWVHAHQLDLHAVWPAASEAQHRTLATALRLDYNTHAASAPWLTMIVRKVLSCSVPGSTPVKRKAPNASAEGQINKPGHGEEPRPPSPAKKKKRKSKAGAKPLKDSSSSSGDDSSSSSVDAEPAPKIVNLTSSVPLACMPTDLGFGPAFAELVAAKCRRSWVGTALFETEVPVAHRAHLFRGKMWDNTERKKYDKMIDQQKSASGKAQRRENPNRVACPHRLTFAWSNDEEVPVEALHLVMVLAGETLSDFAGEDGRVFGGLRARAEYELMIKELREAWANLTGAVDRNENVGAPTITALFDLVYNFLERRYGRYVIILSQGRLREEVLANVARQLVELRLYFATFQRNLSDRCTRKPYGDLAQFAGSRYIRLLGPAVRALLDVDGCSGSSAALSGGGGGGGVGHTGVATPPAARRKLGVSFADGGAGDQPTPTSPFPPPPYPASPGPGGWPGVPHYSTYPAAYHPPSGAAYAPPRYDPLLSPLGGVGWSGYSGPVPSGLPAPAPAPRPATPTPSPRPIIKPDPAHIGQANREGFLSQPQHVYVTGVGYNAVPAGEQRAPPCPCAAKHGADYKPGPHATWDCPFRFIARYGSCPGFLPNGRRDPAQWNGNSLTAPAKQAWVKLITEMDLPIPSYVGARAPNFAA
jgi:hypothetical protein